MTFIVGQLVAAVLVVQHGAARDAWTMQDERKTEDVINRCVASAFSSFAQKAETKVVAAFCPTTGNEGTVQIAGRPTKVSNSIGKFIECLGKHKPSDVPDFDEGMLHWFAKVKKAVTEPVCTDAGKPDAYASTVLDRESKMFKPRNFDIGGLYKELFLNLNELINKVIGQLPKAAGMTALQFYCKDGKANGEMMDLFWEELKKQTGENGIFAGNMKLVRINHFEQPMKDLLCGKPESAGYKQLQTSKPTACILPLVALTTAKFERLDQLATEVCAKKLYIFTGPDHTFNSFLSHREFLDTYLFTKI